MILEVFVVCGVLWTVIGEILALYYFGDVKTSHTDYGRPLVICDFLFVLIFGPFAWGWCIVSVVRYLFRKVSFAWMNPKRWSDFVGKNCSFKRK